LLDQRSSVFDAFALVRMAAPSLAIGTITTRTAKLALQSGLPIDFPLLLPFSISFHDGSNISRVQQIGLFPDCPPLQAVRIILGVSFSLGANRVDSAQVAR
jgi:hypothetical protein